MQTQTLRFVKKLIRERIQKILLEQTDAGKSVFISRTTKIDQAELPVILLYPDGERVRVFEQAPKRYGRNFSLKIEIVAANAEDSGLDLQLETIGEQVENLMEINAFKDAGLGDLIEDLNLVSTAYVYQGEGSLPTGSLILDYDIEFFWHALPEGISLSQFKGTDIEWKQDSPTVDDEILAKNKVDLPT